MGRLKLFTRVDPHAFPSQKALDFVREHQWDALNALIIDGLRSGTLQKSDLDFTPEKQISGSSKGPLWSAFEASVLSYTGTPHDPAKTEHKEGMWLLRSWEIAQKVNWLDEVLKEGVGPFSKASLDQPTTLFQKVNASARSFMWDIQFLKKKEISLSLQAHDGSHVAAPGVVRLSYSSFEGLHWQEKHLAAFPEALCLCNFKTFEETAVVTRTSPLSEVRCLEGSAGFKDPNAPSWSHGTLFIAKERSQMDAFSRQQVCVETFESALDAACSDSGKLQDILQNGFEPDQFGEHRQSKIRPLNVACQAGNLESIQALIARGSSVNKMGNEESGPIFDLILHAQGESLNLSDNAVSESNVVACLDALLAAGADVNEVEPVFGETPLTKAACGRPLWLMRALIDRGADVMHRNADGKTVFEKEKVDNPENGHPMAAVPLTDSIAFLDAWRAGMVVDSVISSVKPKTFQR